MPLRWISAYQWCDHIILVYIEEMYLDIFSWKLLFRESTCIVFWYDDWYDNIIQCIYWAVLSNWGQLCIALQRVNMYFEVIISCAYFRNTNLQLNIIWQKFQIISKIREMIWEWWYDYSCPSGGASGATLMFKYHIIVSCFHLYDGMITF